jgi:hypothetical protein
MKFLTEDQFEALTPSKQKVYFSKVMEEADTIFIEAEKARKGKTHGSAFLWISLYGKNKISTAFRAFLKQDGKRIMRNYRGSTYAYYLGSQSDLGKYDGFKAMASVFNKAGITGYLNDEWD